MHGVAGLPAWFAPRGLLGRLAFDVRPIGGGRLGGVLRIPPQLLSHLRHFALQPHNAAFVPVNDHPQCRLRRCWNLRPQLWRQGRRAMHRATALISTATALQVRDVKEYYWLLGRGDSNHEVPADQLIVKILSMCKTSLYGTKDQAFTAQAQHGNAPPRDCARGARCECPRRL